MEKKKSSRNSSIIYVNFAPYENAGNILTFLLTEFHIVCVITLNFHRLSKLQETSHLLIFENGKLKKKYPLPQMNIPEKLVFIMLPVRILVIFFVMGISSLILIKEYGSFDYFLSVNAFTAWIGNILRIFGMIKRTVFWVWDYYPATHPNPIVRFSRLLYWTFDREATLHSDDVIFLNTRLVQIKKKLGIAPGDKAIRVVPIGTDPITKVPRVLHPNKLVFFAVLKKSQGLDLVFDALEKFPVRKELSLHVIGGGPDENYFRIRAKSCPVPVTFHGFVSKEDDVDTILSSCHIGLAPYIPDASNVSPFTDPSKIKRYVSHGIPVITTRGTGFAPEIENYRAGAVIDYDTASFLHALRQISRQYHSYQKNALALAQQYSYRTLYSDLFRGV